MKRERPLRIASASIVALTAMGAVRAQAAAPSVAVTTAPVGREVLKDRLKGFGTVTLSATATSDVSFQHGGRVTRLDVQPGQKVAVGQPLVTITTDPASALSYRNAVAAQGFAQRDVDRAKTLLAQHLATNAQLAAANKTLADADAALANEKVLGDDKGSESAAAPSDGFVASVAVSVGDRIAADAPVMRISSTTKPPRVTLGLEPNSAAAVRPGMTAFVTPVYGGQDVYLKGAVAGTAATVDPTTHLVDAWIDLPAGGASLAVGSGVGASIILSEHEAAVVPRDAVLHDDRGDYLFIMAGGIAKRVDVKTGLQTDRATEILTPLDAGSRVVTVGNYELKDGMAVRDESAGPVTAGGRAASSGKRPTAGARP